MMELLDWDLFLLDLGIPYSCFLLKNSSKMDRQSIAFMNRKLTKGGSERRKKLSGIRKGFQDKDNLNESL